MSQQLSGLKHAFLPPQHKPILPEKSEVDGGAINQVTWLFSSLSITELNVNDGFIPLSIVIVNFAATTIQRKQFLVMKIQMSNHL